MSYVSRKNWKHRSSGLGYSKQSKFKIRGVILFIFLLFVLFEIITSMFLISYRVESISMEPTIASGSVVLATPLIYGPEVPFTTIRIPEFKNPARGDLVISCPAFHQEQPWYFKAVDSLIRFFTLQKKGFSQDISWINSKSVKRVVGLPGDTVKMINSEILIRPEGKNYFFSEKEIMQIEYSIENYIKPELLPEDFPLSGNMQAIKLGPDEYFLAGDNRSMSNDSYYWGPVGLDNIKAKVILKYAPEIKVLQ